MPGIVEEALKKGALSSILWNLLHGVPLSEGVKVTEVGGLRNMPSISPSVLYDAAKKRFFANDPSLGRYEVGRENPDRRRFAAAMGHVRPFYQENELKRLNVAVDSLARVRGIMP